MNKLTQRIITAFVLIVVLLLVFFTLPAAAALGVLGIFVIIAAWEWSGFLSLDSIGLRAAYVALLVGLIVAVPWAIPEHLPLLPLLSIGLAWWCCAFVWVMRYPTPIRRDVGALCGLLVILPAWAGLVALFGLADRGAAYVLFVLAIVWAADIGAYFVGRRIGRHKLAPSVSPGKTWEGLVGGLVAAAAAAGGGAVWFGLNPVVFVAVGVAVAAISVVGDLTVSMFKRNAGLKDSGNLFPGHGGVLDRVDSVTAAVPLFVLALTLLGLFEQQ